MFKKRETDFIPDVCGFVIKSHFNPFCVLLTLLYIA